MKAPNKCAVCLKGTHGILCDGCRRSFDRWNRKQDGTVGLIEWAAKRARRCMEIQRRSRPLR